MAKHEEFLKQVKERAEAATPGPWTAHDNHGVRYVSNGADGRFAKFDNRICEASFSLHHPSVNSNMNFIAAANPQAVLNLLAIIEKLKEQRSHAYESVQNGDVDHWIGTAEEWSDEDDKELDEIVGLE